MFKSLGINMCNNNRAKTRPWIWKRVRIETEIAKCSEERRGGKMVLYYNLKTYEKWFLKDEKNGDSSLRFKVFILNICSNIHPVYKEVRCEKCRKWKHSFWDRQERVRTAGLAFSHTSFLSNQQREMWFQRRRERLHVQNIIKLNYQRQKKSP